MSKNIKTADEIILEWSKELVKHIDSPSSGLNLVETSIAITKGAHSLPASERIKILAFLEVWKAMYQMLKDSWKADYLAKREAMRTGEVNVTKETEKQRDVVSSHEQDSVC